MTDKKVKNVKKRHWAFVLYPESAPADWFDRLERSGLRGEISPLHDQDENPEPNPETGRNEMKKAHYHVMLCYDGPTTYNAVKALTDSLNCPRPQPLESVRGYDRYLTHQDNPEKHQYERADVRAFGGFNIMDYVELTSSEKLALRVKVMDIIREADLVEYSELLDLLRDSDMMPELETAMSNTLLFRGYIESRRCSARRRRASDMLEWPPEPFKPEPVRSYDGKVIDLADVKE